MPHVYTTSPEESVCERWAAKVESIYDNGKKENHKEIIPMCLPHAVALPHFFCTKPIRRSDTFMSLPNFPNTCVCKCTTHIIGARDYRKINGNPRKIPSTSRSA